MRSQRRLNLDEVEQAIERLERAIKVSYPTILYLYLESDALKQPGHSAGLVTAHEPAQTSNAGVS